MAKKVKINPFRMLLQSTIGLLIIYLLVRPIFDKTYTADFEAYCPFGGLQAFSSFLANNSLACSMTTTQIFMGFALLAGIILVSKLFCSHLCPIGSFSEWLGRKGKRLKVNIDLSGWPDRLLRVFKYALLFITFYFSVTSSELFCKTFDPYYAVFSGFSSDVVVSYAVLTLLLAIPGSFFIRQFWCKYMCPLGAISNIFSYSYLFLSTVLVYILLTMVFNLEIHWLWLLGTLTIMGVALEVLRVKTKGISFFRITRNADTCTNCKLCDKACPMALKVSDTIKVSEIDCHLCGDCVASCPENNTLQITSIRNSGFTNIKASNKLWIPAVVVVLLVVIGLAFSERVHIPTISITWADEGEISSASIYDQEGLSSIKCYGSSMSFANHMKEVPGIMGVETYVGSHGIRVWYDSAVINAEEVKRAIFTPVKRIFNPPYQNQKEVSVCEAAIDNFFDPNDAFLLSVRLSQNEAILGIQTQFGEPVHALIFFDDKKMSVDKIKNLIEAKKVSWQDEAGEHVSKTNFIVASINRAESKSLTTYLSEMYDPVEMEFNNFDQYDKEKLQTITIPFSEGADPELEGMPWYLLSHLSFNRGIVSFKTVPTENGFVIKIDIVKDVTNEQEVIKMLKEPELSVHLSDGTQSKLKNPYTFSNISF